MHGHSNIKFDMFSVFPWRNGPHWARPTHYRGFTITPRLITFSRTPLDEWSARRRDFYLYNTQHSQQTDIHAPGGNWTRNPSKRAAADRRLKQRGHWDSEPPYILYIPKTATRSDLVGMKTLSLLTRKWNIECWRITEECVLSLPTC